MTFLLKVIQNRSMIGQILLGSEFNEDSLNTLQELDLMSIKSSTQSIQSLVVNRQIQHWLVTQHYIVKII